MKEVWEREDYIERGLTSSEVEEHIASGKGQRRTDRAHQDGGTDFVVQYFYFF